MSATLERPVLSAIVPDERRGVRNLPTWEEQHVIDLYAEGYSHTGIGIATGWNKMRQVHMLHRLQVPLRRQPSAGDYVRFMSDTEIRAGGEAMLDRGIARLEAGR